MSTPRTGKYGTAPDSNPDYRWVQVDATKDRDKDLQWFIDIETGIKTYGCTDGFVSDHIHVFFQNGTDSGLNVDPVSGQVSKDGSGPLGFLSGLLVLAIEAATAGAFSAFSAPAAIETAAKDIATPSGVTIPGGLFVPPTA